MGSSCASDFEGADCRVLVSKISLWRQCEGQRRRVSWEAGAGVPVRGIGPGTSGLGEGRCEDIQEGRPTGRASGLIFCTIVQGTLGSVKTNKQTKKPPTTLPTALPKSCDIEFILIRHIVRPEPPWATCLVACDHPPARHCVEHGEVG